MEISPLKNKFEFALEKDIARSLRKKHQNLKSFTKMKINGSLILDSTGKYVLTR